MDVENPKGSPHPFSAPVWTHFDRGLQHLTLDREWFPDAQLGHVTHLASLPVDPERVSALGVLGPDLRDGPDRVAPAVLDEGARDDLQRSRHRAVGPLTHVLDALRLLTQALKQYDWIKTRHQLSTGIISAFLLDYFSKFFFYISD